MIRIRHYIFPCILLTSIILGGFTGYFFGAPAHKLKPLGDIFLNLIFTTIVPLIFFSVSSAVAKAGQSEKLGKLFFYMMAVFIFTGLVAAIFSLMVVTVFPFTTHIPLPTHSIAISTPPQLTDQFVKMITAPNFMMLFSHENILPLIIFSILTGLATLLLGEKSHDARALLKLGEQLTMKIFSLIMYYAPIGFFAYFAVLVADIGPAIMQNYLQVAIIYYAIAIAYFILAFSFYAYLARKREGVKLFWQNALIPTLTALATCSSAATIPANLEAAHNMKVPPEIYETTIPLGTIIHKEGSIIGGIIKIVFLFSVFHLSFGSLPVILTAIGIALLVGTAMGAIPSGGMLGELVILSAYGFPASVLLMIAAISVIIDPPATVLNAVGNAVSSMLVWRFIRK